MGKRYYVFCGRLKQIVICAGEKINCEEVEMAVIGHAGRWPPLSPSPTPIRFSTSVCARCFVLRGGAIAPRAFRNSANISKTYGLAKYKWPERIEVVSEFPLTTSGKLEPERVKRIRVALSLARDSFDHN